MFSQYPDIMSVAEAAEALRICESSIYRMVKERTIGHRKVGRKILIPKVCLIDYVTSARYLVSKE